jgi:energy-coupling factor transporter transmembrane protein EcfT
MSLLLDPRRSSFGQGLQRREAELMAVLSFLSNNWLAVGAIVLVVVALVAVAWFLKNWKVAAAAVAVLAIYFGGQALWTVGYNAKVAEVVAAQTKQLQDQLDRMNRASEADAKRAQEDADKIAQLESKANETPANTGACLDIDGARRVRDIR